MGEVERRVRIGIDLGGTKIEGIVLSDTGEVNEKLRVATPAADYEQTVASVCEVIQQLQAKLPSATSVGIGTPGALASTTGLMKNSNSVCLNDRPLHADIEAALGYTVRLENDANCLVLSEAHYGAARNAYSVFGAILGTGCGGGVVIDNKLVSGPNQIAGEWGHNALPSSVLELVAEPRRCHCGRSNCIETVLSGRGLKQSFLEQTGRELDAADIAAAALDGDAQAQAVIAIYSQQLARCLATVVNLLDPEVIVLGGGLSNIASLYDSVLPHMAEFVFTTDLQTRLVRPQFGDASGAIGAACLWPLSQAS